MYWCICISLCIHIWAHVCEDIHLFTCKYLSYSCTSVDIYVCRNVHHSVRVWISTQALIDLDDDVNVKMHTCVQIFEKNVSKTYIIQLLTTVWERDPYHSYSLRYFTNVDGIEHWRTLKHPYEVAKNVGQSLKKEMISIPLHLVITNGKG